MKNWHQALLWILVGMLASAVLFIVVSPPRGNPVELVPAPSPAPILVQVDGAVSSPGVYSLPRDSRVQDAIQAAGGLRENANRDAVNLAERLRDGQKISIPYAGTPAAPAPTIETTPHKSKVAATQTPSGPVNLNTATLEELETLPGVGPTRAQQIIDYRSSHGGFKTIEEIQNVPGIGPATFEKMKDRLAVQ